MAKTSIDGQALKILLGAGVKAVAPYVELINELNVFPVPDGDTGINLFHTLNRAWAELENSADTRAYAVAERFAYGALMGARGNSGTIMSQLLAGFAEGLGEAETVSAPLLAAALRSAVKRAYAAVSQPVEGTVLTVAREAVESLHEGQSIDEMFLDLVTYAQASLEDTPNHLPILKDAGVVDAGAMGLVCFLRGIYEHACGAPMDGALSAPLAIESAAAAGSPAESYGYDVQFLMLGAQLDAAAVRSDLEKLGWSVIVVGDDSMIKVHIHVENPAIPLDYAVKTGASLDDIVVENMQLQAAAVARQSGKQAHGAKQELVSVIAVVEGDGMRGLYHDLNCAIVIEGGAGKNPATQDFIAAINELGAEEIIILPNNRNIELAAQQAADMSDSRRVTVVPTRTSAEGVNAIIAFDDASDGRLPADTIVASMREAALATTSIEITRATRSARLQGVDIRANDCLAIIDGQISVAAEDIDTALRDALKMAGADHKELATLYYGAGLSQAAVDEIIEALMADFPNLEYEAVYGGQALYPLIVSVE